MSSRHLVDPELLAGLSAFPPVEFSAETLPMMRAGMAAVLEAALAAPPNADVVTEQRKVPAAEGREVNVLIHTPKATSATRPAVLHMHSGGYVAGSAAMMTVPNQMLALAADCVVVAVDYRLAPETRHPGPIEDCYVALKWVQDNAAALGVDPSRIAVMGESAGGGLAAALALLARDRGEVAIVHQHLIYPMLDDRTSVTDPHPYAGEFVWTRGSNHFGWSALLAGAPGAEDVSAYAAAARATDLTGLPSAFIAVGALDLLLEEGIEYARRLTRAGVPTELHVYPGAYHAFDLPGPARVAVQANQISLAALRRALHSA